MWVRLPSKGRVVFEDDPMGSQQFPYVWVSLQTDLHLVYFRAGQPRVVCTA